MSASSNSPASPPTQTGQETMTSPTDTAASPSTTEPDTSQVISTIRPSEVRADVPLPRRYNHSKWTVLLSTMEVSESFWVPLSQKVVASYCGMERNRSGRQFATRSEKDGDIRGTRVWRLA